MNAPLSRRSFLTTSLQAGLACSALGGLESLARAIEPIKRTGSARYRISLVAYSFRSLFTARDPAQRLDLFQFVDFAARHGCDGVELTQYYFPDEITEAYLAQLRQHIYLRGLAVSGTGIRDNFALPKGRELEAQIAEVKQRIGYAQLLGAPYVRVFSGAARGISEAEATHSAAAALEECAEYAGKRGIYLGLENDQGLTTTVEGTLAILGAVKSKWLGANLDLGNFFATDDVYGDLEKLAPYAINVHFKPEINMRRRKREPLDLPRIARMLGAVNYQGYLGLEYESDGNPLDTVPAVLEQMRRAFPRG